MFGRALVQGWWLHQQRRGVHGQPQPHLRDELRRLFKLVHPDLFHAFPEQQATNQRSFQLLQEYLAVIKGSTVTVEAFYKFEFYVHKVQEQLRGGGTIGLSEAEETVSKVEICLPPPQVRHHPHRGTELLPATRSAIGRLLSEFGLSPHFSTSGGILGSSAAVQEAQEKMRMPEFLMRASEMQRQSEAGYSSSERRLIVVRNALRVGRGVTATFRGVEEQAEKIEALEALARTLDSVPVVPLTGCTFVISGLTHVGCCGVDAVGRLWLHLGQDGVRDWAGFISQLDVNSVSIKRAADNKRRLEEFKLAKLMEVEMVLPENEELGVRPEYMSFLEKMAVFAAKEGAVGDGKFHGLPLRMLEPSPEVKPMSIDSDMGCLRIQYSESAERIYEFIKARGGEALRLRDKFKWQEERSNELKVLARKQLGLRHLTFDEERVRLEQAEVAFVRLVKHAERLRPLMEGLSVCISDKQKLGKLVACIRWDFSESDLY